MEAGARKMNGVAMDRTSPNSRSAQLCKGLRKAGIWCSASCAYSEVPLLHDELSGTAAGAVALRRQLCYTVNSVEFSRREV